MTISYYAVYAWRTKDDREHYGHNIIKAEGFADAIKLAEIYAESSKVKLVRISEVGYQ